MLCFNKDQWYISGEQPQESITEIYPWSDFEVDPEIEVIVPVADADTGTIRLAAFDFSGDWLFWTDSIAKDDVVKFLEWCDYNNGDIEEI